MNLKTFSPDNLTRHSKLMLERLFGLDLITIIHPEDVGLDSKVSHAYEPSGYRNLYNLLKDFNITSEDSIIDIGCGKGSAMLAMLKFPFKKIDGIEISDYIANIAKQNLKRLNFNKKSKVFIGDASLFREYDTYNFVYLFNPFPKSVMSDVIDTLIQSIGRSERELIIIYNNATCNDVIVSKGVFTKVGVYPYLNKRGIETSIYSNRSYNNSRLSSNKKMQCVRS